MSAISPTDREKPTATAGMSKVVRLLIALVGLAATLYVLWLGFDFLRDRSANKWVVAVVAIFWGVGGAMLLYFLANAIVESLPETISRLLQPLIFVGPALAILIWYLALPVGRTFGTACSIAAASTLSAFKTMSPSSSSGRCSRRSSTTSPGFWWARRWWWCWG